VERFFRDFTDKRLRLEAQAAGILEKVERARKSLNNRHSA
jgi:hypothetical protein